MDQEQKTLATQAQDPVVSARVIRNIANVERDWHLASGLMSERLMTDIRELLGMNRPGIAGGHLV